MSTVKIRLTGTTPLVMHSNRLVDPLHPLKKEIAAITIKKKKTDADHLEISRLEFIGSIYCGDEGPFIPGANMRACLITGAKRDKMGSTFKSAIFVENDGILKYDGPRDVKGLWEKGDEFAWRTPVGNQSNTIMRTRPRFNDWETEFTVDFDEEQVNIEHLENALRHAEKIGICDARALGYGKFSASITT